MHASLLHFWISCLLTPSRHGRTVEDYIWLAIGFINRSHWASGAIELEFEQLDWDHFSSAIIDRAVGHRLVRRWTFARHRGACNKHHEWIPHENSHLELWKQKQTNARISHGALLRYTSHVIDDFITKHVSSNNNYPWPSFDFLCRHAKNKNYFCHIAWTLPDISVVLTLKEHAPAYVTGATHSPGFMATSVQSCGPHVTKHCRLEKKTTLRVDVSVCTCKMSSKSQMFQLTHVGFFSLRAGIEFGTTKLSTSLCEVLRAQFFARPCEATLKMNLNA